MESTRKMMIVCVMVLGVLLIQAEAKKKFRPGACAKCVALCVGGSKWRSIICGASCVKKCVRRQALAPMEIDSDYNNSGFCRLGCITFRNADPNSAQTLTEEKIQEYVDECTTTCDKKN